jgi:hypothetical protein
MRFCRKAFDLSLLLNESSFSSALVKSMERGWSSRHFHRVFSEFMDNSQPV